MVFKNLHLQRALHKWVEVSLVVAVVEKLEEAVVEEVVWAPHKNLLLYKDRKLSFATYGKIFHMILLVAESMELCQ